MIKPAFTDTAGHAGDGVAPACAALFLDFDGTLADIAPHPESVALDAVTLEALARLKQRLGGALAIVSGRKLATLDALLAPLTLDVAGLHGAECRLGGRIWYDGAAPAPIRHAIDRLTRQFAAHDGLLVEDKGRTVALHWRQARDRAGEALAAMDAIVADLGDAWRLQRGKAVAEIVPAGASKGTAIAQFLAEPPYRGRCPIFIGDDLTDEHGFEVVNAKGGVSVHVGTGPTRAQLCLASPREVRAHVKRWADGGPIAFNAGDLVSPLDRAG